MSRSLVQKSTPLLVWGLIGLVLSTLGVVYALRNSQPHEVPKLLPLQSFNLVDHDGEPFSLDDMKGSAWIVDFVFIGCAEVCPRLTERMLLLQKATADYGEKVKLATFSVDPSNDTPDKLKAYGQTYGADYKRWRFITGDDESVEKAVVQGFKMAMGKTEVPGSKVEGDEDEDPKNAIIQIFHGEKFVLVDADGMVRGYYDSDEPGRAELLRDLEAVAAE